MANYADVTYKIKGAANEIAEIEAAVKKVMESDGYLFTLLNVLGLDREQCDRDLRGTVDDYVMEGNECMIIHCTLSWNQKPLFLRCLCRMFPSCKVYWESIEPGEEIYGTNSFKEFNKKYVVISVLSGYGLDHRFETLDEAIAEVIKALDKLKVKHPMFRDKEKTQKFLTKYNEKEFEHGDGRFVELHEFDEYDDEACCWWEEQKRAFLEGRLSLKVESIL